MSCRGPEVMTRITKVNIQLCVGVVMETYSVDISVTHTQSIFGLDRNYSALFMHQVGFTPICKALCG